MRYNSCILYKLKNSAPTFNTPGGAVPTAAAAPAGNTAPGGGGGAAGRRARGRAGPPVGAPSTLTLNSSTSVVYD